MTTSGSPLNLIPIFIVTPTEPWPVVGAIHPAELPRLIDDARHHAAQMQAMTDDEKIDYIERVMASATVVFGMYPSADAFQLLKGAREILPRFAAAGSDAIPIPVAGSVFCCDFKQRQWLLERFGDGRLRSDS